MSTEQAAHVIIRGRVQGVGFRYFVQREAQSLHLGGWVRNCPDGSVEASAEGPKERLDAWIERLKKGPSSSRVDHVDVDWLPPRNVEPSFIITT